MNNIHCNKEGCIAPICPADIRSGAQWFPDEDVCKSLAYSQLAWLKTQKKIKRLNSRGGISDAETCFTQPMLQAIKVVRRPKGMRPEDLYKKGNGWTSTMRQFHADMPLNSLKERGWGKTLTDLASSKFKVTNQGLKI